MIIMDQQINVVEDTYDGLKKKSNFTALIH